METKSEITRSTSSSPASTVITSELGFVYFFFKTHAKNVVNVYRTLVRTKKLHEVGCRVAAYL